MARKDGSAAVKMAFEEVGERIPIANIQPLRVISATTKSTPKYAQIVASIREVGVIEPPVVARDRGDPGKYLMLDGHVRLQVLKDLGETEVVCLISTDDEAFTYNRRISRIAIVQEHKMILKAVERGVSEERIAKALNVNIAEVRKKRRLLVGICPEAAEILKDKHVPINSFTELRKLAPIRQIEAAELMVAMNKFSVSYAKSIYLVTPPSQLADNQKRKTMNGLSDDQLALMERESSNLDREFKVVEQTLAGDHLDLVLAMGYLGNLLGNARVVRYLAQHHAEYLAEFQRIAERKSAAA